MVKYLSVCCLSLFCCLLTSAEAYWEFPDTVVPQVDIRVPLKIKDWDNNVAKYDPPKVEGMQWLKIQPGGNFTQIINGVRTQEQTLYVTLRFDKVGTYTIPAFPFYSRNGDSINVKSVNVEVSKSNLNVSGDAYAEVSLSAERVVPGEVFTLNYKIGFRLRKRYGINDNLGIQLPDDLIRVGDIRSANPQIQYDNEGQTWTVSQYSIDLKASKPGNYVFKGQQEYGAIQERMFTKFFNKVGDIPIKEARIEVMPLPSTGQPANFSGLIGTVTLDAQLDRDRIPLGKNVVLTVTVSEGQIEMLQSISIPDIDGLTIYEADYEFNEKDNTKTFNWTIVPQREGSFTIPAIEVPYFDSNDKRYRSIKSKALSLIIVPGKQRELGMVGQFKPASNNTPHANNSQGIGMLMPSPTYGEGSMAWSPLSSWLSLLVGIALALLSSLLLKRNNSVQLEGPIIKKQLIQALAKQHLEEANQAIHQLIPHLHQNDVEKAQVLLSDIERCRFGGQQLNNDVQQNVKNWSTES